MKRAEILELDESFHAGIRNGSSSQLRLHDKGSKALKFLQLSVVEARSHVGCAQDETIRGVRRDRNQLRSLRLLHLSNFIHQCAVIANWRWRFFAIARENHARNADDFR